VNPEKPRLELRSLEPGDAEALFTLTERNRARLREWLPWLDDVVEVANSLAFIEATRTQEATGQGPTWGMIVAGELVGVAGFHPIKRGEARGGLGYWIDAGHEGNGSVMAACRALIDHGFLELDLRCIEIRAAKGNERSRSVAERLGFRFESVRRESQVLYGRSVDEAIYSLLRADWHAGSRSDSGSGSDSPSDSDGERRRGPTPPR